MSFAKNTYINTCVLDAHTHSDVYVQMQLYVDRCTVLSVHICFAYVCVPMYCHLGKLMYQYFNSMLRRKNGLEIIMSEKEKANKGLRSSLFYLTSEASNHLFNVFPLNLSSLPLLQ